MKAASLDFHDMLHQCREASDVELVWQTWMSKLGYVKSGIFVISWESGTMRVTRHSSNWEEEVLSEYFKEGFYRFDIAGNPLRKSSVVHSAHVEEFDVLGKPPAVHDFVDFAHSTCLPGEISVPITVSSGLRLGFNGWTEGTTREFALQSRENNNAIRQAANAGAAKYMQLTNGIIYPIDNPLSPREIECLLRLAMGDRHADISERLGVGKKAVEMHVFGARRKLKAKTATEAVVIAILNKYIVP